jgi:hypothetical protein
MPLVNEPSEAAPALESPAQNRSEVEGTLGWIELSRSVLPNARPMENWERLDADDFFWQQFSQ